MFRNNLGCIRQFLRSLKLSLRVNDLGPPLHLRLRLLSHSPLHLLWQINVLELHQDDLDSPRISLGIQDGLDSSVDLVPLSEKFI